MLRLSLFILFSITSTLLRACPFCGCGNSNFQVGVLPTFQKAFVGIRYNYAHFNSTSMDGTQFSRDYFHVTELWGGYQSGRFQYMVFVPYLSIHKLSDDGVVNQRGLGDITMLAQYQVLVGAADEAVRQQLWLGGGIKLKTGAYIIDVADPDFTVGDFSATPGTGSTDYLLNATHQWVGVKNGLVTNLTYRINTANTLDFKYGNRLYLNTAFFHSMAAGTFVLRPSAGINYVQNGQNQFQGQSVADSQGYVLSAMVGLNVQRNKLGLLINGFVPLRQDQYMGQTELKGRSSVSLTYSF